MNGKSDDTSDTDTRSGCCTPKSGCSVEAIVTVDERGQMVLPKDVRERAHIRPGDKMALISWEKDGSICCFALMKTENLSGMVQDLVSPLMQTTGV